MKFKIKNCPECAYWNSPERLNPSEFCVYHESKEDQPPEIIKAIKKEKKSLRNWRIILWTITAVLGFCFLFLLFALPGTYQKWKSGAECKHFFIENIGSMIKCGICLPLLIWMIYRTEKDAKRELKELKKKKNEWIIERKDGKVYHEVCVNRSMYE